MLASHPLDMPMQILHQQRLAKALQVSTLFHDLAHLCRSIHA
jgi:hypothetical protein